MKLKQWSMHGLHLPYVRKVVWEPGDESGSQMIVLRLEAEDGSVGAAEVPVKVNWYGTTMRTLRAVLEEIFLPILQRTDLLDESAFIEAARKVPEHASAKTLIDTALCDLRAAIEGRPLWRRWGGGDRAPLSWLLTRQAPRLMAEEAADVVGRYGFREIKLKGGQGMDIDIDAIREVRAAVGDKVHLYVDCNSHYRYDEMPGYLGRLEQEGIVAIEDPYPLLPDERFERLQRSLAIPILVDYQAAYAQSTELFCGRGARAVSLKPARIGLTAAWEQARAAYRAGARAHVGFAGESAFGTLSSLQLASSLPRRDEWLAAEVSFFVMFREQFTSVPLDIVNGEIRMPDVASCAELIDWGRIERLSIDK